MFYTYIISCKDQTLYTGYTTDIRRRIEEHKKGINSKYTRARGFSELKILFSANTKSDAMKLEYAIKKLTKTNKLRLIEDPSTLNELLNMESKYSVCDINLI